MKLRIFFTILICSLFICHLSFDAFAGSYSISYDAAQYLYSFHNNNSNIDFDIGYYFNNCTPDKPALIKIDDGSYTTLFYIHNTNLDVGGVSRNPNSKDPVTVNTSSLEAYKTSNFTFYRRNNGRNSNTIYSNYSFYVPVLSYSSWDDLISEMNEYDSYDEWFTQHKDVLDPDPPKESLPNFTYQISKKWSPRIFTNILQYNFYANWNCEEFEIYCNAPNNYYVECKAKFVLSGLNASDSIFIDKQPIVTNELSFSIDDVCDKLLNISYPQAPGMPAVKPSFYVMLRVISSDSSLCSDWHFYLVEPSAGNNITDSGSFSENDNGDLDLTEPPSDSNTNINNSNLTKDPNGNKTSASSNPDSSLYDDSTSVNSGSVYNTLKSNVDTVKNISSLLATCYQWFPSWLLSLISASIGIIVVVGLIKIIRG